jgi:hypothetical protein
MSNQPVAITARRIQMQKPEKYTDAQWKFILESIEAEQQFEMTAAFGSGVQLVDVVTGKKYTTK